MGIDLLCNLIGGIFQLILIYNIIIFFNWCGAALLVMQRAWKWLTFHFWTHLAVFSAEQIKIEMGSNNNEINNSIMFDWFSVIIRWIVCSLHLNWRKEKVPNIPTRYCKSQYFAIIIFLTKSSSQTKKRNKVHKGHLTC